MTIGRFALLGQWSGGFVHEVISPASEVIRNLETLERYTEKLQEILTVYQGVGDAVGKGAHDTAHQLISSWGQRCLVTKNHVWPIFGCLELGRIEIRTFTMNDKVCCAILDNGPGIAQESLQHIFEPFFTVKPEGKGTGLGLSVARAIVVNKHQDQLLVDSIVGLGATFTDCLPLISPQC